MKAPILSIFFFQLMFLYSQDSFVEHFEVNDVDSSNSKYYSRSTYEFSAGWSIPISPVNSGHEVNNNFFNPNHVEFGYRYMLNSFFGVKSSLGYSSYNELTGSVNSFNTTQKRFNIGVSYNLGKAIGISAYANNKFGLLSELGGFYSRFGENLIEKNGGFYFGLLPQYKVSDSFALSLNLSLYYAVRQHLFWSGNVTGFQNKVGLNSVIGLGCVFYPKKTYKHPDWL